MTTEAKEDRMSDTAADIWGHCDACRRWFSCPGWFDKHVKQPTCPVCASEPSAIENRALAVEAHR